MGMIALLAADLILAWAGDIALVFAGVALWGLHMGLTQGLLATLVADTAPMELRGVAFGLFNFAAGLAMVAGSVCAGALWDWFGPTATFLAGAVAAVLTLAGIWLVPTRLARPADGPV